MRKKLVLALLLVVSFSLLLTGCGLGLSSDGIGKLVVTSVPTGAKVTVLAGEQAVASGNTPFEKNIASGTYTIKVTKDNYADWTQTVTVNASTEPTTVNAQLISLFGEIALTVTDEENEPVEGVRIFLGGTDTEVATAADGTAHLTTLEGTKILTLKKELYDDYSKEITVERGKTLTLAATLQKPVIPVGAIALTVKNTKDEPVAGVKVLVDGLDVNVTTDAEGKATINTQSGEKNLTLSKLFYAKHTEKVNVVADQTTDVEMVMGGVNYTDSTAVGGGSSWGAQLGKLYSASDGEYLYVKLTWVSVDGGNNVYMVFDDKNLTSGLQATVDADFTTGWGALGVNFIDGDSKAFFDADAVLWGWRNSSQLNYCGFNAINAQAQGVGKQDSVIFTQSADGSVYEMAIPYASIGTGAKKGDAIQAAVLFGKDKNNGGIHSILPYTNENLGNAGTAINEIHSAAQLGVLE